MYSTPIIMRSIERLGAAMLVGMALNFGTDEGSKPVNAQTPTPDATSTKLALDKKAAERGLTQAQELVTMTAIARQVDRLLNPTKEPTKIPTPDRTQIAQVTQEKRDDNVDRHRAAIRETAQAIQATSTPTPRPAIAPLIVTARDTDGPPWEKFSWEVIKAQVVGVLILTVLAYMGVWNRNAILRLTRDFWGITGRGGRWLWQHRPFGGGGGAAPAGGGGPAGGAPGAGGP